MPVKAHNTTTRVGIIKKPPKEGSKTQKRKQNKSEHMKTTAGMRHR